MITADHARYDGWRFAGLRRFLRVFATAALVVATMPAAHAQNWPARPVTVVMPFAAGGPIDPIARLFAQRLSTSLAQPVVVENRAGAGSTIGAAYVAAAAPDGYTLLFASNSALAIAPHVYKSLSYDPLKSFAPVSLAGRHIFGFSAHPSLPVKDARELIEYARARPGELNYGSSGVGTGPHLFGEALKASTGIQAPHVPYKGGGPALADLIAGRIQFMFDGINAQLPHIRAGKIRALAVVSNKRFAGLPDVPTIAELGLLGSAGGLWTAMVAPAGTPPAIVERLSAEVQKAMAMKDVVDTLTGWGVEPVASTPEELGAILRSESEKWGAVVRAAGVKAE